MNDDEHCYEVSEDENCRVTLIPSDDGTDLIEIEMTDELAEHFDRRAVAVGLSREAFLRYLMDGCSEPEIT
jgi:hypothetical protein